MKRTIIYTKARTEHHLVSGNRYPIDRRLERRNGAILVDRSFVRHPEIAGVRSILLPEQHLWVLFFEGHDRPHPMRCYIHMARIIDGGESVTIEDLYLDVIVYRDGRWQLVDVDEFRAAMASGELSPDQVQDALLGLEHACRMVDESRGDVESYLRSGLGL